MQLKIALARMLCEKGALETNLHTTLETIREADSQGIDIVGFPEANLTGYVEPSLYPQALLDLDDRIIRRLIDGTRGMKPTALVGIVESQPTGLPYLTQLVIQDGILKGMYRKRTIPEDEQCLFAAGDSAPTFSHNGITFGIAICADIGNRAVYADAAQQGASIVFELAAPGLYGEQATRDWQSGFRWWQDECLKYLQSYTQSLGIWAAVATQAGRTTDEDFPGGAYVFDPSGRRRFATPDWSSGVTNLLIDLDKHTVAPLA